MRNAGREEAQAGIKIARGNINDLRYADDTTLLAESEEELKNLLKAKEESEKLAQKTKMISSSPISSWRKSGNSGWLYFGGEGLQNHCRCRLQPWN